MNNIKIASRQNKCASRSAWAKVGYGLDIVSCLAWCSIYGSPPTLAFALCGFSSDSRTSKYSNGFLLSMMGMSRRMNIRLPSTKQWVEGKSMASLPALPSILKPVWLTPTAVAKSSAHPAAVLVIRCHRLNRCGISSTNEAYAGWSDRAANNPAQNNGSQLRAVFYQSSTWMLFCCL